MIIMENITIPVKEYKKLLKYKKLVQMFETQLHSDDLMLVVAKEIDKQIKEGKMRTVSEKKLLEVLG